MKKEKNITVNEENGQNERNANMTDEETQQFDGNVAVVYYPPYFAHDTWCSCVSKK